MGIEWNGVWDDGDGGDGCGCGSYCRSVEAGGVWKDGSEVSKDVWFYCTSGYYQDDEFRPEYWVSVCGDGLEMIEEACDDGDTENNDGYSSDWTSVIDSWVWRGGSQTSSDIWQNWTSGYYQDNATNPEYWVYKWGDGHEVSEEACDDGNILSNDGCNSNWTME